MTSVVAGSMTETKVVKNRGVVCENCFMKSDTGKRGIHSGCKGLSDVNFSSGRTIELKRFEFCRVRLSIGCSVPDGIDRDTVLSALEEIVLEFVKREEKVINGETYELQISDSSIDLINNCPCRKIMVAYGLTLKSGKSEYESEQVDISEEIPLTDGVGIISSMEELSNEIAGYLDVQHKRIKGLESVSNL